MHHSEEENCREALTMAGRFFLLLQMVLQVSGSGVTPFVIPQQSILLRAMASVLTTVSLGDLRVRYVTSSANLGRRLLSESVPQV